MAKFELIDMKRFEDQNGKAKAKEK